MGVLKGLRVGRIALGVALAAGLPAQPAAEYDVKAAFLYNFAKFVEWPQDAPAGPISIGVIGRDPFEGKLEKAVLGKRVNGREFAVLHLRGEADARACHIVFIGPSEQKRLPEILRAMQHWPVLTVGDSPGFCAHGGVIGFKIVSDRVGFDINPDAAERAQLRLSSKLLSVAGTVREGRM